jgi:hypothetical protein
VPACARSRRLTAGRCRDPRGDPAWQTTTAADYLALGHCDRPERVGDGTVPAYYSGSPDLARTVNLIRLTADGEVLVTREPLRWDRA